MTQFIRYGLLLIVRISQIRECFPDSSVAAAGCFRTYLTRSQREFWTILIAIMPQSHGFGYALPSVLSHGASLFHTEEPSPLGDLVERRGVELVGKGGGHAESRPLSRGWSAGLLDSTGLLRRFSLCERIYASCYFISGGSKWAHCLSCGSWPLISALCAAVRVTDSLSSLADVPLSPGLFMPQWWVYH